MTPCFTTDLVSHLFPNIRTEISHFVTKVLLFIITQCSCFGCRAKIDSGWIVWKQVSFLKKGVVLWLPLLRLGGQDQTPMGPADSIRTHSFTSSLGTAAAVCSSCKDTYVYDCPHKHKGRYPSLAVPCFVFLASSCTSTSLHIPTELPCSFQLRVCAIIYSATPLLNGTETISWLLLL